MYFNRPTGLRTTVPTALTLAALLLGLAAALPAATLLRQEQAQSPSAGNSSQDRPNDAPEASAPEADPPGRDLRAEDPPADAQANDAQSPGAEPREDAGPGASAPPRPTTRPTDARADDADRALAQAHAQVDQSYLEPVLAERLAELAQARLRRQAVTAPMWRQAAALLEAAGRLSPRDPRFPRLLVEARLKMQDVDGAIEALSAYRRVDPADQVAQIQLIDLYADRIETADARLEYLRDLLDRTSLPDPVRSHVATRCVPLLAERSQDEAMSTLDEALRLNPVNPDAVRLRYDMMGPDATPAQRCAVLLSMLRSNPAQPEVVGELAGLLASVGLARESVEWYTLALRLYPRLGKLYPDEFVSDLGSQLMFTGQEEPLETLLSSYLKAKPDDADAWFMRLVKEKAAGDKDNAALMEEARQALRMRWAALALRMAGRDPQQQAPAPADAVAPGAAGGPGPFGGSGSRPGADIGAPAPGIGLGAAPGAAPGAPAAPQSQPPADPAEAVRRFKAGEAEELTGEFVSVASDLAWFELYFAEKPESAVPWVAALKELLTAENLTVIRLEGWLDLLQGRPDQASEKLASISDRDPLAALGLIRLAGKDAAAQAQADELATRLQAEHPRGLVAAMVWSGLLAQGRQPKVIELPAAAEVRAEMDKFPKDWVEIINQPTSYYRITAEVLRVAHKYGEPMLGRVRITNVTDYPLTIGENGVIRPDLWFDARLGGLSTQAFPGVAYDRIARAVVLPPKTAVEQVVRIDQGALGATLSSNPSVSTQVLATVMTNPVSTANGVAPGPAGHRQPFIKAMARGGFPLSQSAARKRAIAAAEAGTPGEKLRNLEMMATYVRLLSAVKELDDATRAAGTEFADVLGRSREDKVSSVSAWATFLSCRVAPPESRAPLVDRLAANANWPGRLLGLIAAEGLPAQQQLALAERLAQEDAEPVVKEYAAATAENLRNPPPEAPPETPGAPGPAAPATQGIGAGDAAPIPSGLSVPSQSDNNAKRGE